MKPVSSATAIRPFDFRARLAKQREDDEPNRLKAAIELRYLLADLVANNTVDNVETLSSIAFEAGAGTPQDVLVLVGRTLVENAQQSGIISRVKRDRATRNEKVLTFDGQIPGLTVEYVEQFDPSLLAFALGEQLQSAAGRIPAVRALMQPAKNQRDLARGTVIKPQTISDDSRLAFGGPQHVGGIYPTRVQF